MTVFLPAGLPAASRLSVEGCAVDEESSVIDRSLAPRPLTVVLVNLMPDKQASESEFARLLAGGPRDVRLLLAVPDGYVTASTPADHLARYYRPFSALPLSRIDAVIVTGAPVETVAFEDVRYWDAMERIFDWLDAARVPAFHVCWAAQAALHHYHGVPKRLLARKRFGVFPHVACGLPHPLLRGVAMPFFMPVSRHTETRITDLSRHPALRPMLVAPVAGIGLVQDRTRPALYCMNHPEYEAPRLHNEFLRDRRAGKLIDRPVGYYREGRIPAATWHAPAEALFANWMAEVAATDPRKSADVALDWLMRAQIAASTHEASGTCRPH